MPAHEPRPRDHDRAPAFPADVLARHLANTAHELAIGTVPGRSTSCVRQLGEFADTVQGIAQAQRDIATALGHLADHLRGAPGLAETAGGELNALVSVLAAAAQAATSTGAALAEAGPLVAETVAGAGEDTRL